MKPDRLSVADLNSPPKCPALYLTSGFLDDPREPLVPGHTLYPLAAHALAWQAAWQGSWPHGHHQHRGFWQALLPLWPRERAQTRERRALLAAYLRRACSLTRSEIADLLCVHPDTIRRYDLEAVGLDLCRMEQLPVFAGHLRWLLEEWGTGSPIRIAQVPRALVPWVTTTAEEPPGPPFNRNVNDEFEPTRTPAQHAEIEQLLTAIEATLREMVHAGELVKHGVRLRRRDNIAA